MWAVLLYLVSFIITYRKSGSTVIEGYGGDRSGEYQTYLRMIERRGWYDDYLLNTCLFSTYFPSLVYRLVKRWKWEIFRASAPVFYALLPAFTYLTGRYYFDSVLSLMGAAFVMSHFYFSGDADTGRNGIAGGIIAVSLWGLLGGNTWVFGAGAVLVVFAHYTASFIYLFALLVGSILMIRPEPGMCMAVCVYTAALVVWYGVVTRSRHLYLTVAAAAVKGKDIYYATPAYAVNYSAAGMIAKASSAQTVQRTRKRLITKSRVLIAATLAIAGFIAGGYGVFLRGLDGEAGAIVTAFLFVTGATMLSPALATAVGIYRVYFTGIPAITLLFIGFVEWAAGWAGFTAYGAAFILIVIYWLCNNGGMAYLLGEKR